MRDLSFEPLSHDDLGPWLEYTLAEYVKERVSAGDTLEAAQANAESTHERFFPDGEPAPGHLVGRLVSDGVPVGQLWVGPTGTDPLHWWVWDIEIYEGRRGQGLGRRAMLLAEELATERGASTLGLNVFGNNHVARGLYTSLGYQELSVQMRKPLLPTDRVVLATRDIAVPAATLFELIADPAQQPRWDGNDNLAEAKQGQRITAAGQTFVMATQKGNIRENHVVEFTEGRRIAWQPAELGQEPFGHLWRWELEPLDESHTRVTHTYDWTGLTDESRFARARSTTADNLQASLDRLAALAEGE